MTTQRENSVQPCFIPHLSLKNQLLSQNKNTQNGFNFRNVSS